MIVVGTGPAGLTAAYLLARRGHKVTLIDSADEPGGLWAGWEDKGRHFERGMHNYMSVGIPEIDDFFFSLPLQRHPLEGPERDLAGVYYNGRLYCNSPSLDLTEDPDLQQIVKELLWSAFAAAPAADRALDRAAALFGLTAAEKHIKPILTKIYGTAKLLGRALDLTNLHRLVVCRDPALVERLIVSEPMRDRIAYPHQDQLPEQYSSGRVGFYPSEGMVALVRAAIAKLQEMGVVVELGVNAGGVERAVNTPPVIWAAGLPALAKTQGIALPPLEARALTVVNLSGIIATGPLHYFYCYEPQLKTFRVTSYSSFSFFQQTAVELLDVPADQAADVALNELRGMGLISKHHGLPEVVGVHALGPALPLPSPANDHLLDHLRSRCVRPGLHLVGSGARNGLFFQQDVLRHVWNVIHCNIGYVQ